MRCSERRSAPSPSLVVVQPETGKLEARPTPPHGKRYHYRDKRIIIGSTPYYVLMYY